MPVQNRSLCSFEEKMDQTVSAGNTMPVETQQALTKCRLCGGPTKTQFQKRVLARYDVRYHRCENCRSLQSDYPHWLQETYRDPRPIRDTAMASRTIACARWTSLLASILRIDRKDRCLDWGGGNGLYCRLMRDRGFDFLSYDRYVEPFYCVGFTADQPAERQSATLVTAVEVFEHLPDPGDELARLFATNADAVLFSTLLYRDQDEDWFYLAHQTGAHVFFYSRRGLRELGAHYGYDFIEGVELHLFIKRQPRRLKSTWLTRRLIKRLLGRGYARRLSPVLFDVWRNRRASSFYRADRAKIEERFFTS